MKFCFLGMAQNQELCLVFDVLTTLQVIWLRDLLLSLTHRETGRMSKTVVRIMLLRYQFGHVYFWKVEKCSLSSDLNTNTGLKYYILHSNSGFLLDSLQKDTFLKKKTQSKSLIRRECRLWSWDSWTRAFILKSGLQGRGIFKHTRFSNIPKLVYVLLQFESWLWVLAVDAEDSVLMA